jgi:hypothetical protein
MPCSAPNTVGAVIAAAPSTETVSVYDSSVSAPSSSESLWTVMESVTCGTTRGGWAGLGSGDVGIAGESPAPPSVSSRRSIAPLRMTDLDFVDNQGTLLCTLRLAVPFVVGPLGCGQGVSSGDW